VEYPQPWKVVRTEVSARPEGLCLGARGGGVVDLTGRAASPRAGCHVDTVPGKLGSGDCPACWTSERR